MTPYLYYDGNTWHKCMLHDNGIVTADNQYIGYVIAKTSEVNRQTFYMMVVINGDNYTLKPDTSTINRR